MGTNAERNDDVARRQRPLKKSGGRTDGAFLPLLHPLLLTSPRGVAAILRAMGLRWDVLVITAFL